MIRFQSKVLNPNELISNPKSPSSHNYISLSLQYEQWLKGLKLMFDHLQYTMDFDSDKEREEADLDSFDTDENP